MSAAHSPTPAGPPPVASRPGARVLLAALAALTVLYLGSYGVARDWVAVAVFALPPLLFAIGVGRGSAKAGFWASVAALAWFSHGVMVAWTTPPERALALLETALAVVVIFAASLPGLRARLGGKKKR